MTGGWAGRVVTVLCLWFAVCAVTSVFGAHPSYGLVALALAAGAALVLLLLDTSARQEPAVWTLPDEDPVRPPGEDPRFALLRRVLATHLDGRTVGSQLHDHLTAVADQRLLAHHGVSRRADPERAAALMGPELARFIAATDPYPRLDLATVDALIDRIEAL